MFGVCFCPVFLVGAFSYPVGGQAFRKPSIQYFRISYAVTAWFCDPAGPALASKLAAGQKVKKSLRGSLRESLQRSQEPPKKSQKRVARVKKTGKFSCQKLQTPFVPRKFGVKSLL